MSHNIRVATKSHNIRIDEQVKSEASALFADLGLNLSEAVNVFLRFAIKERGFPFPVKMRETESVEDRRAQKFREFLEFAKANPAFEKGFKFDRDAIHER